MTRIAIIGLGLIGGSMGLALKASPAKAVQIVGYDREGSATRKAAHRGAIDQGFSNLRDAVQDAAMVIIATPVLAIGRVLEEIAPYLPDGCIVTDTGSTKAAIVQRAKAVLPPHVSFVGGHPMAGKEASGIDAAQADLFRDRPYCIVPLPEASERSVAIVSALASLVGSRPLYLDPYDHDQFVAAMSHMPLVVSTALFTLARASASWGDLAAVAGPAFGDLTRLASGSPEMSHDICLTNREAIVHWLDRIVGELQRYRDMIQDSPEELYQVFARAQMDREEFQAPKPAEERGVEMPRSSDVLLNMLLGEALTRRTKEMTKELPGLIASRVADDLKKEESQRQSKRGDERERRP